MVEACLHLIVNVDRQSREIYLAFEAHSYTYQLLSLKCTCNGLDLGRPIYHWSYRIGSGEKASAIRLLYLLALLPLFALSF